MAFGNLFNLGGYFFLKYVIHRRNPDALDGQAPQVTPLIMLPVIQVLLFNKHCEVLVSCSDWVDWIDFKELHACDMLSKAVISTACQL